MEDRLMARSPGPHPDKKTVSISKHIPGMEEHFHTYYQSPIGLLRISGTENYISGIHFIDHLDNPQEATFTGSGKLLFVQCVEQLIQYFQGQRRDFDFPVSQEGSAFQHRVWDELLGIPFGKTISYLQLARDLGDSHLVRAAATATGKNNIAIVVPCHRVIGSDRELVGYGGGLWRKKWLLEMEQKVKFGVQSLF